MMRCARVATLWLVGILAAGAASAQTATPSPGSGTPFYAELDIAATLGHKSDKSVGGEAGMRIVIVSGLDFFLEGGHMGNVGTTELDARAQKIANGLGGTFSASYKVNYFDAGVRYSVPVTSMAHPYLAFGVGLAQVTAETIMTVNGTPVTADSVTFGSDLNGTERKALIMFGGGATVTFATRYFVDLSYRYGRILPKTSVIDGDVAINTQRAQVGVGVRF